MSADPTTTPDPIEQYILDQPERAQPFLRSVDDALKLALPRATRKIAWRMPTYWQGRNVIHFAAFKNHLGIYPGARAMAHFADRLSGYKTSKGAAQMPYDQPLPLELIVAIALWSLDFGGSD